MITVLPFYTWCVSTFKLGVVVVGSWYLPVVKPSDSKKMKKTQS